MTFRQVMVIAGALGFLAVLAGTFGAHGLRGRVEAGRLGRPRDRGLAVHRMIVRPASNRPE